MRGVFLAEERKWKHSLCETYPIFVVLQNKHSHVNGALMVVNVDILCSVEKPLFKCCLTPPFSTLLLSPFRLFIPIFLLFLL